MTESAATTFEFEDSFKEHTKKKLALAIAEKILNDPTICSFTYARHPQTYSITAYVRMNVVDQSWKVPKQHSMPVSITPLSTTPSGVPYIDNRAYPSYEGE